MKSLLKNFTTLFISTLVILGLLELGIRALNRHMGHYPQKDPILHHSLVPKAKIKRSNDEFDVTYQINSYGLRDNEISIEKPANTYRILMLGDSYTFGIGNNLEDTFSKKLEQLLNAQGGSLHYEVINGGCSSYSPILEYLFLVNKGLALHPDLVILNYDPSDVQDDYKYSQIAEFDGEGHPTKVHPIDVQWYFKELRKGYQSSIPYLDRSALYQFVMERYYQLKGERNAPRFYEEAKIISGNIEYDRDFTMRENVGDWKPYFVNSACYLTMIADLLKSKNIRFAIASYPYGNLVSDKEWSMGRRLRGFDNKVYSTKLFDYLADFTRSENIPFLNMTPDFLASKNFPLYYSFDGHFTPAGHEVAAEALLKFVEEKSLVPHLVGTTGLSPLPN
jgi:hypothetical protein